MKNQNFSDASYLIIKVERPFYYNFLLILFCFCLKIRAQASVLKRAVIEEQNKTSSLRETLRNKETTLRKVEQEVDSLGFRNKQLEHRVESLQEDLVSANNNKKGKVRATDSFNTFTSSSNGAKIQTSIESTSDPILSEEFQKKILENAKLTSDVCIIIHYILLNI